MTPPPSPNQMSAHPPSHCGEKRNRSKVKQHPTYNYMFFKFLEAFHDSFGQASVSPVALVVRCDPVCDVATELAVTKDGGGLSPHAK
eukprot:3740910-Amphidinium_carterae.1